MNKGVKNILTFCRMLEYRLILRSRKKAKQLLGKEKRKVEELIEEN
jgi:hypothetical protein